MRCVVVSAFGGPERLVIRDHPDPHANRGQVRVRVHAAGVNPVDAKIAEGGPTAERFGVTPPFGNGSDFAGTVDEADGCGGWSVGDRVYGGARFKAQAEYVVIEDLSTLNATPDGVSDETAAALDIAGRTALAGIAVLGLGPNDTVLVSAAAGGVGILAVQLARRSGARVLAVASEVNHVALAALDVEPLAYGPTLKRAIRDAAPNGVDALMDCYGGGYLDLARGLGVDPGRMNSVVDRAEARRIGAYSKGRANTSTHAIRPLADLIDAGELVLPIAGRYPMDQVADAYRRLNAGPRLGKIVLTIS